jgi:hypothetical protein
MGRRRTGVSCPCYGARAGDQASQPFCVVIVEISGTPHPYVTRQCENVTRLVAQRVARTNTSYYNTEHMTDIPTPTFSPIPLPLPPLEDAPPANPAGSGEGTPTSPRSTARGPGLAMRPYKGGAGGGCTLVLPIRWLRFDNHPRPAFKAFAKSRLALTNPSLAHLPSAALGDLRAARISDLAKGRERIVPFLSLFWAPRSAPFGVK